MSIRSNYIEDARRLVEAEEQRSRMIADAVDAYVQGHGTMERVLHLSDTRVEQGHRGHWCYDPPNRRCPKGACRFEPIEALNGGIACRMCGNSKDIRQIAPKYDYEKQSINIGDQKFTVEFLLGLTRVENAEHQQITTNDVVTVDGDLVFAPHRYRIGDSELHQPDIAALCRKNLEK